MGDHEEAAGVMLNVVVAYFKVLPDSRHLRFACVSLIRVEVQFNRAVSGGR